MHVISHCISRASDRRCMHAISQLEISKGEECTIRIWGPYVAVNRARAELVKLLFLDAKSIQVGLHSLACSQ